MVSFSRQPKVPVPLEADLPRLELSGPILKRAFETLVAGTDQQGGIEQWIDALKLKSRMIRQALTQGHPDDMPLDTFKSLCAFMASVRRRVGPYLEQPRWDELSEDQQRVESRKMEIYAAMVSDLDRYIGEFVFAGGSCVRYDELGKLSGFVRQEGGVDIPWQRSAAAKRAAARSSARARRLVAD